MLGRQGFSHCMPNLMPLKCLGSLSTSCCLTGPSTGIAMAAGSRPLSAGNAGTCSAGRDGQSANRVVEGGPQVRVVKIWGVVLVDHI